MNNENNKPIRVFEAFAGYGSQHLALKRLSEKYPNFKYEVVGISEIEPNAIKAYETLHGTDIPNFGDVSKIKTSDLPDFDLFTYSFPCTDISILGKRLGFREGSGTRSSLLWECKKIISEKKPKYLILENVKNLINKDNLPLFNIWLNWLEGQGYTNSYQIVNSKHFGVPQSRERVFCVSILGEHEPFEFPTGTDKLVTIDDILEHNVDDKYFTKYKFYYKKKLSECNNCHSSDCKQLCSCGEEKSLDIKTHTMEGFYEKQCIDFIDNVKFRKVINEKLNELNLTYKDIHDKLGLETKSTKRIKNIFEQENKYPKVEEWSKFKEILHLDTNEFDDIGKVTLSPLKFKMLKSVKYHKGIHGTLVCNDTLFYIQVPRERFEEGKEYIDCHQITETNPEFCNDCKYYEQRRVTPREFFRLMDLKDEEIDKLLKSEIKEPMFYKLAGNSIVVAVLEALFENMLIPKTERHE